MPPGSYTINNGTAPHSEQQSELIIMFNWAQVSTLYCSTWSMVLSVQISRGKRKASTQVTSTQGGIWTRGVCFSHYSHLKPNQLSHWALRSQPHRIDKTIYECKCRGRTDLYLIVTIIGRYNIYEFDASISNCEDSFQLNSNTLCYHTCIHWRYSTVITVLQAENTSAWTLN